MTSEKSIQEQVKEKVFATIKEDYKNNEGSDIEFDGESFFVRVTQDEQLEGSDYIDYGIKLMKQKTLDEVETILKDLEEECQDVDFQYSRWKNGNDLWEEIHSKLAELRGDKKI